MIAAIIFLLCALALISAMATVSHMYATMRHARTALLASSAVIVAFVILSLGLSVLFKGPNGAYRDQPLAAWVRAWIVVPGNGLTLLLPLCLTVFWTSHTRRTARLSWRSLVLLGVLSIPGTMALGLIIGCQHAGACL